jgi:hypothetical protein
MTNDIIDMKNHHNYSNKHVYDDFIKILMTFLCFCHKSELAYENHHNGVI